MVQVKHIALVQSFLFVWLPTQSKAGLRPGTASMRVCVEVHAHFDAWTQCLPIMPRVIVTMIFCTSELVHLTCVFMYIQSDYYTSMNLCINTLYRYMCALDMCYSLNVMNVLMCVYVLCECLFVYKHTVPAHVYIGQLHARIPDVFILAFRSSAKRHIAGDWWRGPEACASRC